MIEFCLVGAGFIGPVHARNIASHRGANLRYVVDLDAVAARILADRHEARVASFSEALFDPALDAIVICTPPRTHAALIEAAARAGKAIFCEKPIDLDMGKVEACGRLLAETGVPFFVGFNRRFDPTHRALASALRAGELGAVEMLVISSRDPEISPPAYVAAMPYGIFYDTMIHDFDMARWLTGSEVAEVVARTAVRLDAATNPHRDPDTAMALLTMQDGTLVHVNSSFRTVYGYDQRIEAFGEKGMLLSRNRQPTLLERHGADGIRQDPLQRFFIERYEEAYRAELEHFIQCLEKQSVPDSGFVDGRQALAVAFAAMDSAKTGQPVRISPRL